MDILEDLRLSLPRKYDKEKRTSTFTESFTDADMACIGDLKKLARGVFQKWVRLRDKDLPCISCGTFTSEIFHAGHFYPATPYTGMIFDEQNTHRQCVHCNVYLHGNLINYRIGLIKR